MFRRLFLGALAAAAVLAFGSNARAGFQVTLIVDATSHTITDGGVGDSSALPGVISVDQTFSGFHFHTVVADSNTPGGALSFVDAGTNSVDGSPVTAPHTVQIIASANDFTSPTGNVNSDSSASYTNKSSKLGNTGTVSFSSYIDSGNALASSVPAGTQIGTGGPITLNNGGSTSFNDARSFSAPVKYSLTLQLKTVFDKTGNNNMSMQGNVQLQQAAPAPAAVVLALSGLPCLAFGGWFRRRRGAADLVAAV